MPKKDTDTYIVTRFDPRTLKRTSRQITVEREYNSFGDVVFKAQIGRIAGHYGHIISIVLKETEQSKQKMIDDAKKANKEHQDYLSNKDKALNKLSEEEKEVLGLTRHD